MKNVLSLILFSFFSIALIGQEAAAPSAASMYNEGLAKAKAKEYVAALDLFEKAMEAANPDDEKGAKIIRLSKRNAARSSYGVGTSLRKAKDYTAALAAYEKGIGYGPELYTNYRGKAQCQSALGNKAESVTTYLLAADVAVKADKADKAEPMIKKAENIVAVLRGKKKWDETIAAGSAFIASQPSADVQYSLASAYQGKGDANKAIEHIDIAIETAGDVDKSKYYMLKAEAHEKLGQKSNAVAAYKMVTEGKYLEMAQYKVGQLGSK